MNSDERTIVVEHMLTMNEINQKYTELVGQLGWMLLNKHHEYRITAYKEDIKQLYYTVAIKKSLGVSKERGDDISILFNNLETLLNHVNKIFE